MIRTRVLDAADWLEIVAKRIDSDESTGSSALILGVKLHLGGATTVWFEYDEIEQSDPKHPFARVFGFKRSELRPHHLNALLVASLAAAAPEILREAGFEVRADGLPRVGSLGQLEGFEEFKSAPDALDNPAQEEEFQKALRLIFQDKPNGLETFIGFKLRGNARWMFPRVENPQQIRIAAELLGPIRERLRAAMRPTAGKSTRDDPLWDLITTLTAFITLLHQRVGAMPEATIREEGTRWVRRIQRWVPRLLDALKSRDGRIAVMKLVMAASFPRQRPTREQIQEIFEAMGPEAEDALDAIRERARRDTARDLCRDVLRERFGPLPARVREELDQASHVRLRKWLLRALTAPSLRDVFRPRATPRVATHPPQEPSSKAPKRPSSRKKQP